MAAYVTDRDTVEKMTKRYAEKLQLVINAQVELYRAILSANAVMAEFWAQVARLNELELPEVPPFPESEAEQRERLRCRH